MAVEGADKTPRFKVRRHITTIVIRFQSNKSRSRHAAANAALAEETTMG